MKETIWNEVIENCHFCRRISNVLSYFYFFSYFWFNVLVQTTNSFQFKKKSFLKKCWKSCFLFRFAWLGPNEWKQGLNKDEKELHNQKWTIMGSNCFEAFLVLAIFLLVHSGLLRIECYSKSFLKSFFSQNISENWQ